MAAFRKLANLPPEDWDLQGLVHPDCVLVAVELQDWLQSLGSRLVQTLLERKLPRSLFRSK